MISAAVFEPGLPGWIVAAGGAVFATFLLVACATDVRSRRIPNELALALMVCGFAYSVVISPTLMTPVRAAGAMFLGFAIWIPFYALRMLGAGDVKLFAAASTWLAPGDVIKAAVVSALVGGVLGLLWFIRSHGLRFAIVRLTHAAQQPRVLREPMPVTAQHHRLPYGVAMAIGLIFTAFRPYVASFMVAEFH